MKQFVQKLKPIVVCLQEKIFNDFNDRAKQSMGVYDVFIWAEVPPVGQSGGIVTFWDPSLVSMFDGDGGRNWLLICDKLLSSNQNFSILNIYAPEVTSQKE